MVEHPLVLWAADPRSVSSPQLRQHFPMPCSSPSCGFVTQADGGSCWGCALRRAPPPPAAHPHLEHSSGQDDATLAGDGLLALQQVVDEQRDGGKTVTLQPVQVLQRGKAAGSPHLCVPTGWNACMGNCTRVVCERVGCMHEVAHLRMAQACVHMHDAGSHSMLQVGSMQGHTRSHGHTHTSRALTPVAAHPGQSSSTCPLPGLPRCHGHSHQQPG